MGTQGTATYARHGPSTLRTLVSTVRADGRPTRQVRLAALPSAVPWARRVVRHMLHEWQLESMADSVAILVSELVTNAVDASAGLAEGDDGKLPMIGLGIRLTPADLVLEVWDASPLRPVPQDPDIASDHGRGLLLIDALADSWGHRAADGGKIVWCAVAIPQGAASRTAA
jgi:anti-sigma regulatory factor (Ser/Thr protein kinase)